MRRHLIATFLTLSLAGCHNIFGPSEEHELDDAWDHWLALGIDDYSYEVIKSCFCGGPGIGERVVVVVHDDQVAAAWFASDGEPLPPSAFALLPTVEDLFEIVDDAIRNGADDLDVEYDREFGFPRRIAVDYDIHAADDDIVVRSDDLRPI